MQLHSPGEGPTKNKRIEATVNTGEFTLYAVLEVRGRYVTPVTLWKRRRD